MVELQQLCDKVPSFPSDLAFATICEELDVDSVGEVFSEITPEPVAAASLGQVYKATLRNGGAISGCDRTILTSLPQDQLQSALFDNGAAEPTNLVADFQGRLAVDLANSNIRAVEEDTRALAILGRLAGIREELCA